VASGFNGLSLPVGCSAVNSGSGIGSLLQWSSNTGVAANAIAGNGWSNSSTPKLILRQIDVLGARSIALPFNGTDVRTLYPFRGRDSSPQTSSLLNP
jgi:hypothetical protein